MARPAKHKVLLIGMVTLIVQWAAAGELGQAPAAAAEMGADEECCPRSPTSSPQPHPPNLINSSEAMEPSGAGFLRRSGASSEEQVTETGVCFRGRAQ